MLSRLVCVFIGLILLGICIALPWVFGGTGPIPFEIKAVLGAIVSVTLLVSICGVFLNKECHSPPVVFWIPVVGIILGILQIIPLPSAAVELLSPARQKVHEELKADTQDQSAVMISYCPPATRRAISLLAMATSVFFLSWWIVKHYELKLEWILMAIAINGAALSLFSIFQQLRSNGQLYWTFPLQDSGALFGPFVNRNNAANFLNVCMGAALAVALWSFGSRIQKSEEPSKRTIVQHLSNFAGQMTGAKVCVLVVAFMIFVGVIGSMSRGGALTITITSTLAILFALRFKPVSFIPIIGLLILGASFLIFLEKWEPVKDRLATISNLDDPRLAHWSDASKTISKHLATGTGLGTYHYVYRLDEEHFVLDTLFYHAENQTIESTLEFGIAGLVLFVSAVVYMFVTSCRLLWSSHHQDRVIGLFGFFLVVGQFIANSLDLGIYRPVNMGLVAVSCGIVLGYDPKIAKAEPKQQTKASYIINILVIVFLFACIVVELKEIWAQRYVLSNRLLIRNELFDPEQEWPEEMVGQFERNTALAIEIDDTDPDIQRQRAMYFIQLYRKSATEQVLQFNTEMDRKDAWAASTTINLLRLVRKLKEADDQERLTELRNNPMVEHLAKAREHLYKSLEGCTTMPRVHYQLAMVDAIFSDEDRTIKHLKNAVRTNPSRVQLTYSAGVVALELGHKEECQQLWRKCLEFSNTHAEDIAMWLKGWEDTDDIDAVLPNDPKLIVEIAREHFSHEHLRDTQRHLMERAKEFLPSFQGSNAERNHLKGVTHEYLDEYDASKEAYEVAVALSPENVKWRDDFGRLLTKRGEFDEAIKQFHLCEQYTNDSHKYQPIIKSIRALKVMKLRDQSE